MELAFESFGLAKEMVKKGNPNCASDAGVGALCARAAVKGTYLNVKTNAKGLPETAEIKHILIRSEEMCAAADVLEREIFEIALSKMK